MPIQRPDFSDLVAHFTKDAQPYGADEHDDDGALSGITGNACDRLVSILEQRRIIATPMPWTNRRAVAFTECPWWSLMDHARRYSPCGVGFTKAHLFAAGGGPAIYLRPDLHKKQGDNFVHRDNPSWRGFDPALYAFVTPFAPFYAPDAYLNEHWQGRPPVDFAHEREWRVPHDFTFEYDQVQFVVVDRYEDVARFPRELKDAIGRDKFLMMDVYRQIERLWPTHLAGGGGR